MNKKKIIIIFSALLIVLAILFGVYIFFSSYMFDENGKITDSFTLFYERLEELENDSEREELIKFGIENDIISEEEAKELRKK